MARTGRLRRAISAAATDDGGGGPCDAEERLWAAAETTRWLRDTCGVRERAASASRGCELCSHAQPAGGGGALVSRRDG